MEHLIAASWVLLLMTLWLLTHRYGGITSDARLYAIQALAKISPAFGSDLYLQNTSQDRYTIFSSVYAAAIRRFGLEHAAVALLVFSQVCLYSSAWRFASMLSGRHVAWLSIGLLTITTGSYGAFGIFNFSENYLTARSLAEALVSVSLAVHFSGLKRTAWAIAAAAFVVHPLMALPGVLLLACLQLPLRVGLTGAGIGLAACLMLSMAAVKAAVGSGVFAVMDPAWLDVVRERSQFLFLQLWSFQDWQLNARPFLSLAISAIAIKDQRIRKLCAAAALVGMSGLAVALIASLIGPLAVLMQGQAWRWVWITSFVAVLLVAPTILTLLRDDRCGRLCALSLLLGWTFSEIERTHCLVLALMLLLLRPYVSDQAARYLNWAAAAASGLVVVSVLANSWTIISSPFNSGRETMYLQRLKGIIALQIPAVIVGVAFWRWLGGRPALRSLAFSCGVLAALSAYALPSSFNPIRFIGSPAEIEEFREWRDAIPVAGTVYVASGQDLASFAWFTLGRPSYLSIDQSAGVVYSRATSLEVRRRSAVLLPLRDEDWRQLSKLKRIAAGAKATDLEKPPALTPQALISVCSDEKLGFVVAQADVGFSPMAHAHKGPWNGWYLYDCGNVRGKKGGG